jgi:hypothetical protein
MALESLVTDVQAIPKEGEILISVRDAHKKDEKEQIDLGNFYLVNQNHLFFTGILGVNKGPKLQSKKFPREWDKLQKQVENMQKDDKAFYNYCKVMKNLKLNLRKNNLSMADFLDNERIKDSYWFIYQLYFPMNLKDILPGDFIKEDYTQWARRRLTSPFKFVELDDNILRAFQLKNKIKNNLIGFRKELEKLSAKSYATRRINILDDIFDENSNIKEEELNDLKKDTKCLKNLDYNLIKKRKEINDEIERANKLLNDDIKIVYKTKKNKEPELRIEKKKDSFLKNSRAPSLEEIVNFKWAFIDIEIPHFRRKDAGITWIGAKYWDGKKEISRIHTIYDVAPDSCNGYEVVKHKGIEEMIESFTNEINGFNPDIVSSYNTRFDLIKLRETLAGFLIGKNKKSSAYKELKTNPLYKVTTKFFERIDITNRLVIDLFRWQKIARAYDINAKLEMAAGFRKIFGYDLLEKFEDYCIKGGKLGEKAASIISKYLAKDVDSLFSIFNLKEFKNNMEDVLWMSEKFGISSDRLLHLTNVINEFQEEGFFKQMGITRKHIFPYIKTKQTNELERKCLEYFTKKVVTKSIKENRIKGISNDVYKVFIPVGDFFRGPLSARSEKITDFFEYKDDFKGDKQRIFFLEQYAKEFSRWMAVDYARFLKDKEKYNKILSKNKIDFMEIKNIRRDLEAIVADKKQIKISEKLKKGNLTIKDIEELADEKIRLFAENKNIDSNNLAKIINLYSIARKKQNHFSGNYGITPQQIKRILDKRFNEINEFIEKNGLEIVAKEGNYLYLKGNKHVLEREDAPVVMVDEIKKLYHSDKVYYEKNGFFSNIQFKDHPGYHLSMFEMNAYERMIKNLLKGNKEKAKRAYEHVSNVSCIKKQKKENFFFENKSKQRYSSFVKDSEYKNGKIYFMLKKDYDIIETNPEIHYDFNKNMLYFFDERDKDPVKVYVMNEQRVSMLNLDFEKYNERLIERGKEITKGTGETKKEKKKAEQLTFNV